MNLTDLIAHPEHLDRETLYDLRSLLALHPYYQAARILMLRNLYVLHDPTFDEELRRAAVYVGDRRVLFQLVEAAHYRLRPATQNPQAGREQRAEERIPAPHASRTTELIDTFLGSLPDEEEPRPKGRKPTPADAAVDYVAYLMECGEDEGLAAAPEAPRMKGQSLIDNFISREGRIVLPELAEESGSDTPDTSPEPGPPSEDICTETMAQIYVRQGRYPQALEIIKRLNLDAATRNAYYADQIRFLEKLIINSNKTNKQ